MRIARPERRALIVAAGAAGALLLARPSRATPAAMTAAINAFTGGAVLREGRVKLDIPVLVENGNVVPVSVEVQSPMSAADHVTRIAVFNEKNPQPDVAIFELGPHSGSARVAFRMRMAESQRITAIARLSDGSYWTSAVDVIVTLAACLE
ncbi:MAG: SoxY-related AACIE arm protein [Burkholderiaceae bacterium]|nr:SoxY-related AACIE arm protein [Burkholderiaceae bacterium]